MKTRTWIVLAVASLVGLAACGDAAAAGQAGAGRRRIDDRRADIASRPRRRSRRPVHDHGTEHDGSADDDRGADDSRGTDDNRSARPDRHRGAGPAGHRGTGTAATDAPATTAAEPVPLAAEAPATTATSAPEAAATGTVVVTNVVDGDTVDVSTGERVRVLGIDTPEIGQCGYAEAKARMTELVGGQTVTLVGGAANDVDTYGRILRYVDGPTGDAGAILLSEGLGHARYDSRDGYGSHPREEQYWALDYANPNSLRLGDHRAGDRLRRGR